MAKTTFSTPRSRAPGAVVDPKPRTASDILVEAGIAKDSRQVEALLLVLSLILFFASASLLASSVPPQKVEANGPPASGR